MSNKIRKIVLLACANKKLPAKAKARNLYISPLFKKSFAYAELLNPDKIFILSAKHGLLSPNKKIEPYNKTLNDMKVGERKEWARKVIKDLSKKTNLKKDKFIFLTGKKYREFILPKINNPEIPMEGLGIGKQLRWLSVRVNCNEIHRLFNKAKRHSFPFNDNEIPENGIYVLFEKGEEGHGGDRIVRVGTHTGDNQLKSRLYQHFLNENKDRSIFRKNIGRTLLNKSNDSFLEKWNIDLTTKKARNKYSDSIDFNKQKKIEKKVTNYIQKKFSFVVFEIDNAGERKRLESRIISTVSLCDICTSSSNWLGNNSPKKKIRKSGLWLVNELWKKPLNKKDLSTIENNFK